MSDYKVNFIVPILRIPSYVNLILTINGVIEWENLFYLSISYSSEYVVDIFNYASYSISFDGYTWVKLNVLFPLKLTGYEYYYDF